MFSSTLFRLHCGKAINIWITTKAFEMHAFQWEKKPFGCLSAVFISMKCVVCRWYGWRKSWHDLHARVSKNVAHFCGLNGLLLKIEAQRCLFNLCWSIILAISINPAATIHGLTAKTQQLEVVEPSAASSKSKEKLRAQAEIKRGRAGAEPVELFILQREVEGEMCSSPLQTAAMMNKTLWAQLNILSLCEWRVCSVPIQLYS